ncbi:hypothetical protein Fcan01_03556 [Folsomia candida]|uniref:Uncharacterized protein n=1 Tax=Folsomia candida TaxID=158441 RepID=A0A226F6H7_FOLCA|nr:hypothetical protein Fcan01_03556 [Folsomia candida]
MNVSSFGGLGNEEEEENLMGLVHGGVHTNESCANTTGVGGTNGTDINPFYYFEDMLSDKEKSDTCQKDLRRYKLANNVVANGFLVSKEDDAKGRLLKLNEPHVDEVMINRKGISIDGYTALSSFSQIELSTGLKHQDGQECFLTSEENNDDKEVLKFTHCVRKSSGSFHQLLKYRSHIHSNPSMCSKLCSVVHKNSCKFDKALFLSVFLLRLVETKKSVGKSMGKSFDKVLEHNNGHEEINLSNKFEKL